MKNIKKIVCLILSLILILSSIIYTVAEVVITYGNYDLAWINGDTEFKIYKYNGNESIINTPDSCMGTPITEIDDDVFSAKSSLTEINIAKPIVKIGDYAFMNCTSLKSVVLNNNVKNLGMGVFYGCASLKTIVIPESVISIGVNAFLNSGITEIQCYKDSCAHKYAVANNIKFKLLDDPQPTTEPVTEVPTQPTTEPVTEPVTETVTPTEPVKTTYILGDGNDNGHIDISDATVVQLLLARLIDDDTYVSQRININGEGDITNATHIQMYLAKLTTPYDDIIGSTKEYIK